MSTLEFTHIDNVLYNSIDTSLYSNYFDSKHESFNNPLIVELEGLYNNIISSFSSITKDQILVISKFFDVFKYIQEIIDPDRIKSFTVSINDDDDIIFSRKNSEEFISIIIHPEDDYTLSIINKTKGNVLDTFNNSDSDFESIAYSFFK
ncbi:hypothetical protein [Sphingobacterium lactis]|uniref:hypothetical protein n=1 Tax=Sphingobacterium lactis TaxID=797291 RepID=UPI003DA36A23